MQTPLTNNEERVLRGTVWGRFVLGAALHEGSDVSVYVTVSGRVQVDRLTDFQMQKVYYVVGR